MGQIEVFKVLEKARLTGEDGFFRVCDIKKLLEADGKTWSSGLSLQVAQLEAFGYLEAKKIKRKRNHWRAFRLKDSYIEKKSPVSEKGNSNTPRQRGEIVRHVPNIEAK